MFEKLSKNGLENKSEEEVKEVDSKIKLFEGLNKNEKDYIKKKGDNRNKNENRIMNDDKIREVKIPSFRQAPESNTTLKLNFEHENDYN